MKQLGSAPIARKWHRQRFDAGSLDAEAMLCGAASHAFVGYRLRQEAVGSGTPSEGCRALTQPQHCPVVANKMV